MKKLVFLTSAISFLLTTVPVRALADQTINLKAPPKQGFADLGDFVNNTISVAFAFALLLVLVMLIWGAFEWMTSGGDKETVGKARGRIINALIGLLVLAVAFALTKVAGTFVGFDLNNIIIPAPPK